MYDNWLTEEKIPMDKRIFFNIAKRAGITILEKSINGKIHYSMQLNKIPVIFLSNNRTNQFNFLDLADLHIGDKAFNEEEFRAILSKAVKDKVKYVFFSGDLLHGITIDETIDRKCAKEVFIQQIRQAYNILIDYKLNYYAINGNHEYTFEQIGLENPLSVLAKAFRKSSRKFTYIDSYVADFIICGVGKRVMHIETQSKKRGEGVIQCVERLHAFKDEGDLFTEYKGKKYQIRFFQTGHFHGRLKVYDDKTNIYLTQPGALIKDQQSGIFLKGEIKGNGWILLQGFA
jgi:hypothetical protein